MNESSSWASLKDAIQKESTDRKYAVHLVRIENLMSKGIFDSNVCYRGSEFWLEGKYLKRFPIKRTTLIKVGLSKEQELFAIRRLLVGGRLFVWLHVEMNSLEGVVPYGRKKADEGSGLESVGRGWYLFELASVPFIQDMRLGLSLEKVLECQMNGVGQLASKLLDVALKGVGNGQ